MSDSAVSSAPDVPSPLSPPADGLRGEPPRIRFVALRIDRAPSGRGRAEVELEGVDGRRARGSAEVQATAEGDLRAAAAATLDALHGASGTPHRFTLLGVKNVRAFDQHVLLVQLGIDALADAAQGARPMRLVGCATAAEDLMRAAVFAVLNASNRVLWRPPTA